MGMDSTERWDWTQKDRRRNVTRTHRKERPGVREGGCVRRGPRGLGRDGSGVHSQSRGQREPFGSF